MSKKNKTKKKGETQDKKDPSVDPKVTGTNPKSKGSDKDDTSKADKPVNEQPGTKEDDVNANRGKSFHNDPRDYGSEQIVKLSASWSWALRLGNQLPSQINSDVSTYISAKYPGITSILDKSDLLPSSIPGVMALRVTPTIGISRNGQSAVNIAAYNQYGFLRSNISGQRPYTKSDMMIEWLAVDSAFMMGTAMERVIVCANTYSQQNRYLAKNLVEAQGFNYEDLLSNLANYVSKFNLLKSRLNSLKIPAVLPIVRRHAWLMANVYLDDELVKAQMYVHVLHGIFEYNPTGSYYGLRYKAWITGPDVIKTFAAWLQQLESMIEIISADSKFSQISGDIEKAYGPANCLAIGQTDMNTILIPRYDPEVLYQIHHIKFVGDFASSETATWNKNIRVDVTDPATQIIYQPCVEPVVAAVDARKCADTVLDSASNEPTADEAMCDTRLTPALGTFEDDDRLCIISCGSEIVHNASIYWYQLKADGTEEYQNWTIKSNCISVTGQAPGTSELFNYCRWSVFKKAPMLYLDYNANDSVTVLSRVPLCEMKTYTVVNNYELEMAHHTAVQNQFAVPVIENSKM